MHMEYPLQAVTYSSVVSRGEVCIMLNIVVMNDLGVSFLNIGNNYLNYYTYDKVYFFVGL